MSPVNLLGRIRSRLGASAEPDEVERAEWTFYINYLRPGMTVFDVGANVGETTYLFSRLVRPGSVHAFEPGPEAFRRLSAVAEAAELKNVVSNQMAVSDHDGEARLNVYDREHMSWNTLANRPLHEYGSDAKPVGVEVVPCVTIDQYCERRQIEHIDLLKLDVEGAELQCLRGASRMLKQRAIKCCLFEYGATTFDMGNRPQQIADLMRDLNYRLENVVSGEPLFPGGSDGRAARFAIHVARPA